MVEIPIEITSSSIGLKLCAIAEVIKRYKSVIKKKKKKHDKIVLLAKLKLNITEILISKALIDSVVIHDKFCWTLIFVCMCVCVCVCVCVVCVCAEGRGYFTLSTFHWFPFKNSETVKAVTLEFCGIQ